MTDLSERIGKTVHSARLFKGVEISDLAESLELSVPTIYNLEAGRQTGLHTLHRVCHALQIDVVDVLAQAENPMGFRGRPEKIVYDPEYNIFHKVIGQVIAEQREFMGLTIEQLARAASARVTYIKRIENNQSKASFAALQSICGVLDLYMSDFFEIVQASYLGEG